MAKFPAARFAAALALLFVVALAAPAPAQQATSVNPTASAVKEQQLLEQMQRISGRGSIPDTRSYTIEQPAGRDWRQFHEVTLRWVGGIAILGMLALLILFYLVRGTVKLRGGRSGRTIVRFNGFERFVHWMTATCFVIQALTGLNITFGKELLLPLMSPEAFTAWSQWAKYVHDALSFPFIVGVVLIFFTWIRGNIPNRVDVEWFKRGGGIVGEGEPPSYRFNGGQKAVFWAVVILGTLMAASGYLLLFPFYGTGIATMQQAEMLHSILAMLFVAVMLGHIYIGTPMGMEGAFEAMGKGTVDVNWARHHHNLWLQEEQARTGSGEAPQPGAGGRIQPAE
jgi:formate dehydrogenase subunit gamma